MAVRRKKQVVHQEAEAGRLLVRPGAVTGTATPGLQRLGLGEGRDGLLYVPAGARSDQPAPLAVLLHGAGGNALHGVALLRPFADRDGVLLLAPDSRGRTWDIILGGYGPDVAFLDRALAWTFERWSVDPARLAVGGFSDGASYALSLGITNGDLFTHVLAFSPGFMAPADQRGSPHIFVSHGTEDTVLAIDRCSRRVVPQLERAGYDVLYREFEGPHVVPQEMAAEAVLWFLGQPG